MCCGGSYFFEEPTEALPLHLDEIEGLCTQVPNFEGELGETHDGADTGLQLNQYPL